jgi:hypothetical protein
MSDILKLISDTGIDSPDPRVSEIWSSIDHGEYTHITVRLSEFIRQLENNKQILLTTSILHMCSAFENLLANYYALCALYKPRSVDSSSPYSSVPSILFHPTQYERLKQWAIEQAQQNLHGNYSKRLQVFTDVFGCTLSLNPVSLNELDSYYTDRHLIAHDQSLVIADAPDLSAVEVLNNRITISEDHWKAMISTFQKFAEALDESIQQTVVVNSAIHLAIYNIVRRDGEMPLGRLCYTIKMERSFSSLTHEIVKDAAEEAGVQVLPNPQKNGHYIITP